MIELILGGARSGKSMHAEQLAKASGRPLIYLATASANDAEMANRIKRHQERRGGDWHLIEEPLALAQQIREYQNLGYCILIDCLTLWLTNLLCCEDKQRLESEKEALLDLLSKNDEANTHLIFVSNEVGLGIIPLGEINRQFVDEAGFLHQTIADLSQRVIFTVAGIPQVLKGEPL